MRWLVPLLVLAFCQPVLPARGRPSTPEAQREVDALFAGMIPILSIRIPEAGLENLRKNPRDYVEAEIEEQGAGVHRHAGIKLKGSAGSFRAIDSRPGFSVNMDKFKGGRPFHGTARFQLNNCVQDESALRELVAGEIARKAGVPASRCTHAIVRLNGKLLGLYVLKEAFREVFISAFFKNPGGRLYDGGFCADIRKDMELDRGDPSDQALLRELLEALKEPDEARQFQRLREVVDTDAYLRHLALENILAHWDGYSFNKNNYRVYEDPASRRFYFFLHGMDQTFGDANWNLQRAPGGSVGAVLWKAATVRSRYLEILKDVYERVLQPVNWADRTEEVGKRVQEALRAVDPKTAGDYLGRIAAAKQQVKARMDACAKQMQGNEMLFKLIQGQPLSLESFPWNSQGDNAKFSEAFREDRKILVIQANGECKASWRCPVQLPPGKYSFEGAIFTKEVVQVDGPSGSGAGLRISGGSRAGQKALSATNDWTEVRFEFESPGGEHVLVAELCARSGEMWLDRGKLAIRRLF